MTADRFFVKWNLGTVEPGRPTDRWEIDENGYSRRVYTDTIERDRLGNEIGRRPTRSVVGIRWGD